MNNLNNELPYWGTKGPYERPGTEGDRARLLREFQIATNDPDITKEELEKKESELILLLQRKEDAAKNVA